MPTILMTCGETSGEQHAARLVRELKALDPSCHVRVLGGDTLAKAGASTVASRRPGTARFRAFST